MLLWYFITKVKSVVKFYVYKVIHLRNQAETCHDFLINIQKFLCCYQVLAYVYRASCNLKSTGGFLPTYFAIICILIIYTCFQIQSCSAVSTLKLVKSQEFHILGQYSGQKIGEDHCYQYDSTTKFFDKIIKPFIDLSGLVSWHLKIDKVY